MLVMHGGLGLDHTYLRPALDPLSDRVQLTYYDQRGNGRSSRPERWDDISHETWVDDADALREWLGSERMVLFGHSYGAYLALEYALKYGHRLAGLILCSAAPAMDYVDVIMANAEARGTRDQVQAAALGFSAPVIDDLTFERLWKKILPLYFHAYDPFRVADVFQNTRCSAAAFDHAFFRCLPTYHTVDRLREIDVPTLILAGADDWVTPIAQGAARLSVGIRDAELKVFERSGHFPFLEEPDRFLAVVFDWLDRRVFGGFR